MTAGPVNGKYIKIKKDIKRGRRAYRVTYRSSLLTFIEGKKFISLKMMLIDRKINVHIFFNYHILDFFPLHISQRNWKITRVNFPGFACLYRRIV